MQPLSEIKTNWVTLSFPDSLEKRYQSHNFRKSLILLRIALISVAAVYGLFGILDLQLVPEHKEYLFFIRFGIVIPLLVLVLALSFFSFFEKIWQLLLFSAFMTGGVGIVGMLVYIPDNLIYFAGLMLVIFAGYFFIKLRFLFATIAGWTLLLVFNLTMGWFADIPSNILISYNFFYIATNLLSMVAAYYIEYFDRQNFLLNYQLDRRKVELEQVNRSLEHEVKKRTHELAASEEKFRTIFNYSGSGIAILNSDGHLVHANQALCSFLGYKESELIGDSVPIVSDPEDFHKDRALFEEMLQGKRRHYEMDKRYLHKNGQIVWGRLTVSMAVVNPEEPPLIVSMIANINGYKQIQEELLRERIYFEHLFNSSPVGIVLLDIHDHVVDCNNEFTSLFQYTKEEIKGKAINDLIVPPKFKSEASGLSFNISNGRTIYHESTRMRKDGHLVDVAITGKPVFVNAGQVAIYGIYHDISERKKNEEELKRRLDFQENAVNISALFTSTLDIDSAINESLAAVGKVCKADRSYLFLFREGNVLVDNTHEWCAEGIEPQIKNLQGISSEMIPWWMNKLHSGEILIVENVQNLPPEAGIEKDFLESQDIKSLLVIPVKIENKLAGFIGFDHVKDFMTWSDSDIAILKITAEVIGHAFDRARARQKLMLEKDLLQALMDNIPDTIYFKDTDSRFIRINKAQARLLGLSSTEEAIGKTDLDFFNNEHAQIAYDDERKILTKGTPIIGKLEYFKTDGKWRWMSATKVPMRNSNDDIMGLVGVSHDMTEQKNIEERLRLREQFLSHLNKITNLSLETLNTPDLFSLLASEMHTLLSSDICFITLWDENTNSLIPMTGSGMSDESLNSLKINPGEITMTESVLKAEKVLVAEDAYNTPYISPNVARQFPSKSMLGLPLIAYGQKLGAVLIGFSTQHEFTDEEIELGTLAANQIALVVARTRMLEQLLKSEKELLKLNAEKDKLFSVVAHDLRSPFTSFLGLTEIMVDETADLGTDEIREFALAIQKSASGLYQLLENLLEWSRMQGGTLDFHPDKYELKDIISNSLNLLQASAKRKDISVEIKIPDKLFVHADEKMLRSLSGNLISNAIKFTNRGGSISVTASTQEEGWVRVGFKDTGIGMSEDKIKKLFRIDVKVTSQGTEGEPSSGLGLILCKDFIDMHGGKIWVESSQGKGSAFFITLPVYSEKNVQG